MRHPEIQPTFLPQGRSEPTHKYASARTLKPQQHLVSCNTAKSQQLVNAQLALVEHAAWRTHPDVLSILKLADETFKSFVVGVQRAVHARHVLHVGTDSSPVQGWIGSAVLPIRVDARHHDRISATSLVASSSAPQGFAFLHCASPVNLAL